MDHQEDLDQEGHQQVHQVDLYLEYQHREHRVDLWVVHQLLQKKHFMNKY